MILSSWFRKQKTPRGYLSTLEVLLNWQLPLLFDKVLYPIMTYWQLSGYER